MRKFVSILFAISLIFGLAAFQETQIRVDVEAVNIFVTVIDEDGRFVTDVSQDRFSVFEDGVQQTITNFSRETNIPLRLGLLIDTSSSIRLKLDFEKQAASRFIRSVMRRQDHALLVEFDEGVNLLSDFTNRPSTIVQRINELKAGGGTALWDAVYSVAYEKMGDKSVRKALIIVSDGEDLHSKKSIEETLTMLQSSEVTVYSIGTSKFGASSNRKGEENLKEAAVETGGRAFFPYSVELLDSAFDLINEELRSQYSLTYTPREKARDGKFHEIEVRVADAKDYTLTYKRGYWAPVE